MINKASFATPFNMSGTMGFKAVNKHVKALIDIADTPGEIGSEVSDILSHLNVYLRKPSEEDFTELGKTLKRKKEWKSGDGYKDAIANIMGRIFEKNGRKIPKYE
jgi:hypothetical protein